MDSVQGNIFKALFSVRTDFSLSQKPTYPATVTVSQTHSFCHNSQPNGFIATIFILCRIRDRKANPTG